MVGGQGIYVQTRLLATDGSGGVASLTGLVPAGTQPATTQAGTLVTVGNAAVDLEIRVQAPTWAPYDKIEIYRNASTQVAKDQRRYADALHGDSDHDAQRRHRLHRDDGPGQRLAALRDQPRRSR